MHILDHLRLVNPPAKGYVAHCRRHLPVPVHREVCLYDSPSAPLCSVLCVTHVKILNHMGKTPRECEGTGVDRQEDMEDFDDDDGETSLYRLYPHSMPLSTRHSHILPSPGRHNTRKDCGKPLSVLP